MKPRAVSPTIVEESPVKEIVQVARIERRHAGSSYIEPAWSGHRILVIRSGRLRMETSGLCCEVGPGAVVWSHGNELVQGRVMDGPWTGYSILFRAPLLPPPDHEARIRYLPKSKLFTACEQLLNRWLDTSALPDVRCFRVQAELMRLLTELTTTAQRALLVDAETSLWWQVENELRNDLGRSIDVRTMSQLARCSPSTMTRSCRHAVGIPPLKRVKQLRMSLARSLVWMSGLTFTQIARRVGHGRLHEFSRNYHKQFGVSPTEDRERFVKTARGKNELLVAREDDRSRLPAIDQKTFQQSPVEWPKQVAASPIHKVVFVARFDLREPGRTHGEYSFPGHHIQLTRRGQVQITTCGRTHDVRPGGVVWFHNDEDFSIRITGAPWSFCNVSFMAPSLQPPDFAARFQARQAGRIVPLYDALFNTWRNLSLPPLERLLRVQAALLDFLAELMSGAPQRTHVDQEAALWWQVETELRRSLDRPINLRRMSQLVKRSPTTITRACRRAVGMSPKKRINDMRIQMARGLIWMSNLSFKEIASRVGYGRMQELSRDYHKRFGLTPTRDREEFPKTYRRVFGLPYTTGSGRD